MSVRRVMGTEVEYGISLPGDPRANPVSTSSLVVNAYAQQVTTPRRARWDYQEENPLKDARGFELPRAEAHPTLLTDDDPALANVVLTNGARLYVDHAHPEYSSPEVTTPRDVVLWEKAGEEVLRRAALGAQRLSPGTPPVVLYKNNTDNKGVSYGAHENYLMKRSTPFDRIVRQLTPFFVSRQVICGAGRVGLGQSGRGAGFQLSQRADFFETEVGLETTIKRPIINTRDEPHADATRYRRLHVIIGDANLADVSIYLKAGTTALVLAMIEADFLGDGLTVLEPVEALHTLSHDPSLKATVELRDGRRLTGLQLQGEFYERAAKFVAEQYGTDADAQTLDVLSRWESVVDRLEHDPFLCARELDWVAKLQLMEGYRARDGLEWSDAKLAAIDLQYADLRPEKGLFQRLVASGRIERLVTDDEIERAVTEPPEDTRAWFRGRCVAKYGANLVAASWDSVVFDVPEHGSLQRVPTSDPLRGTRKGVEELIDGAPDASALLVALQGQRAVGDGH